MYIIYIHTVWIQTSPEKETQPPKSGPSYSSEATYIYIYIHMDP